ncbi:MAG: glutamate--tRNA ligase, partial [Schwartzia sp.]|nr:glutamate--tRNA ligase [Schwartzia sp. (in: firmicutes)]
MLARVRTRFAPSPTGYMHIGNLRTALYAFLFAKAKDGDFILRIEDTDRARYVEDAVDFINDTLKAAHIVPDEGPGIGGDCGPYVQSERMDIYKRYAEELVEKGFAYRCFCSHDDEAAKGSTEKSFGGYDRHCRELPAGEIEQHLKNGDPYVIRQKMPLSGTTSFFDIVHGNISIENSELEDQVLLKRDGMPTYNFANVIDDHLMDVSHIIRGTEFITSTPKHVLLYEAFGWEPPVFVHLAPVMGKNEDGSVSKLSKRHGSTGFEDLIKEGYLPEAIINYIALLGWCPKDNQEIFTLDELTKAFDISGISKSPSVFDYDKLEWFNGEYIKAMTDEQFADICKPYFQEALGDTDIDYVKLASILKQRTTKLTDIPEKIDFFKALPEYEKELFYNKKSKTNPENAPVMLKAVYDELSALLTWDHDSIHDALIGLAAKL